MINIQNLTMRYGSFTALDNISFEIKKGEILGLLGPNGAGKTTLMRVLTTYFYPFSGTIKIGKFDILKDPIEIRKKIGYLPETIPLYLNMRVDEYLKFIGNARGLFAEKLSKRMEWVREACNLSSVWKHQLSELSKGYGQRVGLSQALIHDPKVLILDEPTSGLDPIQIIEIRSLIKNLSKEKMIIFSTHILQEAEVLADKIVILNEGKLVASGTQKELSKKASINSKEMNLEKVFIKLLTPTSNEGGN